MKFSISRTIFLAAAALVLSSGVSAQELRVQAKVPFNFMLRDKVYPAGEYVIQTLTSDHNMVSISNANGTTSVLAPFSAGTQLPANGTKLVFHRVRGTYFLYRLWVNGYTAGRQFPKSHTETRITLNTPNSETVVVAANAIH